MTKAQRIIDFLETDIISISYDSKGLKYLALNKNPGLYLIDLRAIDEKQVLNQPEELFIDETIRFIETGKHNMQLNLSEFTEFQQSVFKIVEAIEPGKIVTYKDIAETLGKPGGAQAVGNAIGKNPVSYFLPTHRVLPQKGIGLCRSGAGHLREKLLSHEGHDLLKLSGGKYCTRKNCNGK